MDSVIAVFEGKHYKNKQMSKLMECDRQDAQIITINVCPLFLSETQHGLLPLLIWLLSPSRVSGTLCSKS